jgi:hypothetical protein
VAVCSGYLQHDWLMGVDGSRNVELSSSRQRVPRSDRFDAQ